MSYPDRKAAIQFVDATIRPALRDVAQELSKRGADTQVEEGMVEQINVPYVELKVTMGHEGQFYYAVWPQEGLIPSFASRRPITESDAYYRFEVFLNEGNRSYDVMGYTKDQLIADILDCYECHLEYLRLHREAPGNDPLIEALNKESPLPTDQTTAATPVDATNTSDKPASGTGQPGDDEHR